MWPVGPGELAIEGTLQRTAAAASKSRLNAGGNDALCYRPAIRDVLVDRPAGVVAFALVRRTRRSRPRRRRA